MKIKSLFRKRKTVSDKIIDLSPPGVEANQRYKDINFYRCRFHHTDLWPHFFTGCQYVECEFELRRSGRNHISSNCTFDNCIFKFEKAYQYMFNNGHVFRNCNFTGSLKDSVFALEPLDEKNPNGGVFDCHFNELEFDVLGFRGQGLTNGLTFPKWPIVLLQYGNHLNPKFDKAQLPIKMRYHEVGYRAHFEVSPNIRTVT